MGVFEFDDRSRFATLNVIVAASDAFEELKSFEILSLDEMDAILTTPFSFRPPGT